MDRLHHRHLGDLVVRRYRLDLVGREGLFLLGLGDRRDLGYLAGPGYRRHLVDMVFRILRRRLVCLVGLVDLVLLLVRRDPVDLDLHLSHHYQALHLLLLDLELRWHLVDLVHLVGNRKLVLVLLRAF
jgi:hypothetical protein